MNVTRKKAAALVMCIVLSMHVVAEGIYDGMPHFSLWCCTAVLPSLIIGERGPHAGRHTIAQLQGDAGTRNVFERQGTIHSLTHRTFRHTGSQPTNMCRCAVVGCGVSPCGGKSITELVRAAATQQDGCHHGKPVRRLPRHRPDLRLQQVHLRLVLRAEREVFGKRKHWKITMHNHQWRA